MRTSPCHHGCNVPYGSVGTPPLKLASPQLQVTRNQRLQALSLAHTSPATAQQRASPLPQQARCTQADPPAQRSHRTPFQQTCALPTPMLPSPWCMRGHREHSSSAPPTPHPRLRQGPHAATQYLIPPPLPWAPPVGRRRSSMPHVPASPTQWARQPTPCSLPQVPRTATVAQDLPP